MVCWVGLVEWHCRLCHCTVWDERELSVSDHGFCKVFHDWLCLHVEIVQHGVAFPSTYKLDPVMIYVYA